jgi:hypothetical protein
VKSLASAGPADAALSVLSHFRVEFYNCLYKRADALFEVTDVVLCAEGPVTSLAELTLTAEHRRGHGAMYDAVNHGWLEPRRLRRLLASTPLPRAADGRIVLAVDVSNWLRPDALTSPELLFCHVYGRGSSVDQFIPGWPPTLVVPALWRPDSSDDSVRAPAYHQRVPEIWVGLDVGARRRNWWWTAVLTLIFAGMATAAYLSDRGETGSSAEERWWWVVRSGQPGWAESSTWSTAATAGRF